MYINYSKYLGKNIIDIIVNSMFQHFLAKSITEQIDRECYLTNKQKGIGFVFDNNNNLITIHFNDGHDNSYSPFVDELPFGLNFSDNIENVQKKVGSLSFESGGGKQLPILGYSKLWIKYLFPKYYLHIEFHNNGESISLITLGLPQLVISTL
jgi:hypothetical protein